MVILNFMMRVVSKGCGNLTILLQLSLTIVEYFIEKSILFTWILILNLKSLKWHLKHFLQFFYGILQHVFSVFWAMNILFIRATRIFVLLRNPAFFINFFMVVFIGVFVKVFSFLVLLIDLFFKFLSCVILIFVPLATSSSLFSKGTLYLGCRGNQNHKLTWSVHCPPCHWRQQHRPSE